MKILLSLLSTLCLSGCIYTDVYVHEETQILNRRTPADHDRIVDLLADAEFLLYPDLTYFRSGYDVPYVLLSAISKEPGAIHISSVQFFNIDTGLLHESAVDETGTLQYSENFGGISNLGRYSKGFRLSVADIYPKVYGASEIEMTISYSVYGRSTESKTFRLKRLTDVFFILGAA